MKSESWFVCVYPMRVLVPNLYIYFVYYVESHTENRLLVRLGVARATT